MAYTDDAVNAKLSSLAETQDSVVSVAAWVMFHRRHAGRTASLWLERLKDSNSGKRVNLIYLANEVAQQSRAKRKEEFLSAFSPIMPEAIRIAYKEANPEVQGKVKRVVEVWRQRQVFDHTVQEAIENSIDETDRARPVTSKRPLGGSLFSETTTPAELQSLVQSQSKLLKATLAMKPLVKEAEKQYDSFKGLSEQQPSLQVQAHQLNSLLKTLANAEVSVSESLKARTKLVAELEELIESNRDLVREEDTRQIQLNEQKTEVEAKKQEVENEIMRGLAAEESSVDRPEKEDFTPPPDPRSTTPDEPLPAHLDQNKSGAMEPNGEVDTAGPDGMSPHNIPPPDPAEEFLSSLEREHAENTMIGPNPIPPAELPVTPVPQDQQTAKVSADDLSQNRANGYTGYVANVGGSKRRKTSGDEFDGIGFDGELDDDVVGMLGPS